MPSTPRRIVAVLAVGLSLAPLAACGGDDEPAKPSTSQPAGDASKLTVHALDTLKFDETEYTVEAGTIDVEYLNDGSVAHTLLIKDNDDLDLSIGKKAQATIELEPGTYTLYCDIAGHEASGMEAELTVE